MKKIKNDFKEDMIEKLKDPERAENFLLESFRLSLKDGDGSTFQMALRMVAEARGGVGTLSKKAGLQRENTYRILSKDRHPKFDSILKLSKAVGFSV